MARRVGACAIAMAAAVLAIRANAVPMAQIAHEYVRLVPALGHHDADYVDAYYGPPAIKAEADAANPSLGDIARAVDGLRGSLKSAPDDGSDELSRLRRHYLEKQLATMAARVRMLQGQRLS